jgi:hypothetical protein
MIVRFVPHVHSERALGRADHVDSAAQIARFAGKLDTPNLQLAWK